MLIRITRGLLIGTLALKRLLLVHVCAWVIRGSDHSDTTVVMVSSCNIGVVVYIVIIVIGLNMGYVGSRTGCGGPDRRAFYYACWIHHCCCWYFVDIMLMTSLAC